ncbi:MAG: DUF2752 domain-containing protein [Gloeomargarita sp. GMQP_bins_120]
MTRGQVSLTPTQRRDRWIGLGMLWSPVVAAFFYNRGWQIPGLVCPLYHVTGIPCPSCGLTRSFMALARGDILQAVRFHAFGPLLFGAFFLLGGHLLLELALNRAMVLPYRQWLARRPVQWGLLGLFLGYYLLRLAIWYQRGELPGRVEW